MAAIITDQIRILNAKNFVSGVQTSTNAYYSFIGLPNATDIQTDWDTSPVRIGAQYKTKWSIKTS